MSQQTQDNITHTATSTHRTSDTHQVPSSDLHELVTYAATHSIEAVLTQLGSSPRGLTPDIAQASLELHGPNVVETTRPVPLLKRLFSAFASPFTLILVVLAIVSLYTNVIAAAPGDKDPSTTIIIAIMVIISGTLEFTQASKGASAAAALKHLVTTTCCVRRAGNGEREIPMSEVVPGDIVRLAAGDLVPGDVRILSAKDLFMTQAALTGESEPVEKLSQALPHDQTGLRASLSMTNCNNIAFAGTTVQSGSATAVVLCTGADTYLGKVAHALNNTETSTAFDDGVASVSRVLVGFMLVMCPIVFLVNGFTKGDWLDALLFAISIAVGITPQMLPVIVTTCLSRGATVMSKHDVIVKNLGAIQNLGAMDVLCCDKTGTLTQDKVILERHMDVNGHEDDRVLRHAYLNSRFQTGLHNLIDEAIIGKMGELGDVAALDNSYRKVDEIPFDFERRRMSVVVADKDGKTQMVTKGAAEEILAACNNVEIDKVVQPLTPELSERVHAKVRELGDEGMRVIAVAQKTNPRPVGAFSAEDERDMVLIGYLAFLDPPKPDAEAAVKRLREDGVTVKVLTGDNDRVAAAVCAKVGIEASAPLLGSDIDGMSDEELAHKAETTQLFAKLSPLQKSRLVRILREKGGHTVGFMGDGINDAAAMRASDAGISVDTAVDVAKESADIILLKKDLMVLSRGIREGRKTYGNTIKYIKITASSNFGNVLSVLVASAFLPFLPMSALQLLLLGLAYTVSCTAIPWDRIDEDFLRVPRSWNARSIVTFMLCLGPVSSIFDIITYFIMFFGICPLLLGSSFAGLTDPAQIALFTTTFQTGWFVESMWTQTFVIHILRTERMPFIHSMPAPSLTILTFVGVALITALPYIPGLSNALGLSPLPLFYFGVLLALMAGYFILSTIAKRLYIHHYEGLL